jgi:hypothetical protein
LNWTSLTSTVVSPRASRIVVRNATLLHLVTGERRVLSGCRLLAAARAVERRRAWELHKPGVAVPAASMARKLLLEVLDLLDRLEHASHMIGQILPAEV